MNEKGKGIKAAIIGSVLYILFMIIFFNTQNINVLISGLYLGFTKDYQKRTALIFFLIVSVFLFVNDIFIKNVLDPSHRGTRGVTPEIIATIIASFLGALFPLAISWIVRKIRKAKSVN